MNTESYDSEEDIDYEPAANNVDNSQGRSTKRKRADSNGGGQEGAEGQSLGGSGGTTCGSSRAATVADPLAQLRADTKKAKINAIWEQMKGTTTGRSALPAKSVPAVSRQLAGSGTPVPQKGGSTSSVPSWMLNLGLAKSSSRPKPSAATAGGAPAVAATSQPAPPGGAAQGGVSQTEAGEAVGGEEGGSGGGTNGRASWTNGEAAGVKPRTEDGGDEGQPCGRVDGSSQHGGGMTEKGETGTAGAGRESGEERGSEAESTRLSETSSNGRAVAAAALAAAKAAAAGAMASMDGKMKVTEVRDFAGQAVEVTRLVDPNSKEALAAKRKADMQASSAKGLDAMLAQIEKKKKLSILDKSRKDWGEYKEETGVTEELESFKKSGGTYTEKIAFLSRADLREYEKERDARLAAQARRRPGGI